MIHVCHSATDMAQSSIFQRLTDAIRYIMASRGISITNHIDDLIGIAIPSQAKAALDQLHALLQEFGVDISDKKRIRLVCV